MPPSRIRPARRAGLGTEVTESLRQAIFDGTFTSGDHLGEIEIAQELDVSRGPVREALLQLRAEGLVSMELHRGSSVVTLTEEDIAELTTLRTTLERMAIELAIERRTDEDLGALDAVIAEMRDAVRAGDSPRLTQLDIRFHDRIFQASGHRRLVTAWSTIRSQMLLFLLNRADANQDYLTIAVDEHQELAALIRDRDRDRAPETIALHVRGAYDRLSGALRPGQRSTGPRDADESDETPAAVRA